MASEAFHIQYSKLQEVVKIFQDQATCVEEMIKNLQTGKRRLDQSWSGEGYNKFNEEMNSAVFPKLEKLHTALETAAQLINQLAEDNKGTESLAKSAFQQPILIDFSSLAR